METAPHRSPPHGTVLPPHEHELLRGRPPAAALAWAAAAIAPGARVRSVRPLAGGTSSAVHVLAIDDQAGRRHRLVLRRFVRADWLAEEPDLAAREATALDLLHATPLATPRLVAVDPRGDQADVPAVLMTRLPGRIEWDPLDLDDFLRRLAAPLPIIHATPTPSGVRLPSYRPYALELRRAPVWASQPAAWSRAVALHDGPMPAFDPGFIHRDYHPGNVLWTRGQVRGVVDWVNACLGPPEADVAHCRINLVRRFGLAAADRFLDRYRAVAGRNDYHPYWDITCLDTFDDERPDPRGEEFIARAVAAL